jgi:hypothetical protein
MKILSASRVCVALISIGVLTMQSVNASSASKSEIYNNTLYNFSIQHPIHIVPQHQFASTYLSANVWTISAQIQKNNSQQHNVVEFPIYTTTFNAPNLGKAFYNLSLRIGVSTDKTDVQQCLNVESPGPTSNPKNITINDINFMEFSYSEGAMMKSLSANIYRTVHKNACYSIDAITYKTNVNLPKNVQSRVSQKNDVLNKMVQSFRVN